MQTAVPMDLSRRRPRPLDACPSRKDCRQRRAADTGKETGQPPAIRLDNREKPTSSQEDGQERFHRQGKKAQSNVRGNPKGQEDYSHDEDALLNQFTARAKAAETAAAIAAVPASGSAVALAGAALACFPLDRHSSGEIDGRESRALTATLGAASVAAERLADYSVVGPKSKTIPVNAGDEGSERVGKERGMEETMRDRRKSETTCESSCGNGSEGEADRTPGDEEGATGRGSTGSSLPGPKGVEAKRKRKEWDGEAEAMSETEQTDPKNSGESVGACEEDLEGKEFAERVEAAAVQRVTVMRRKLRGEHPATILRDLLRTHVQVSQISRRGLVAATSFAAWTHS